MADHKSAIKRNRQNQKRREINRRNLKKLRTQLKKINAAIALNNSEEINKLLSPTLSLIDRSIQKGVIHRGAASRRKSRLMDKVNALPSRPAAA